MNALKTYRIYFAVTIILSILLIVSCKKDKTEEKKTVPTLSTKKVTNIQSSNAVTGGDILNNGGADISEIGICWSSENNNPTISDDFLKHTSATESSYTAIMQNLIPSSPYYVRAYAKNDVGVGYGDVITFSTGNAAPSARSVIITGKPNLNELLTGSYAYYDAEGNLEALTTLQWYQANDMNGTGEVPIAGATSTTLRILDTHQGKYIRFGVKPKAATGVSTGLEVKSDFIYITVNAAPVVSNVRLSGSPKAHQLLNGAYLYADAENNAEAETVFQWYMADDLAGNAEVPILRATGKILRLQTAQQGKYIRFGVTPKAIDGTLTGMEIKSQFSAAVAKAATLTFKYNGADITYDIIESPESGRKWLDRNLGASRSARAIDDQLAAGDLFQWGRQADGHQLIMRSGNFESDITPVFGMTSPVAPFETSDKDVPGTNKFILVGTEMPYDWRVPQNDRLWQGTSGVNNPCPEGWRIPTSQDFDDENLENAEDSFNKLKLTYTGQRNLVDGSFSTYSIGFYWTSTFRFRGAWQSTLHVSITGSSVGLTNTTQRATGMACRCVKD